MKTILSSIALILILLSGCESTRYTEETPAQTNYSQENVSYNQFYEGLSPYGRWMKYPGYGNVWVPLEQGFRPYYSNGHWAYTNYGWTWVSGYQWGWATFHYGRWFRDNNFGWVWSPGYEWAPAWVSWRSDDQYYGWAPMGPSGRYEDIDDDHWAFVQRQYINQTNINNYYINQQNNRNIIRNTTIINNNDGSVGKRTFNQGPTAKDVEAITNKKVKPLWVKETNQPVVTSENNGTLTIYKPALKNPPIVKNNGTDPYRSITNENDNRPNWTKQKRQIEVPPKQEVHNVPPSLDKNIERKAEDHKIIITDEPKRIFKNNVPVNDDQPVLMKRNSNDNRTPSPNKPSKPFQMNRPPNPSTQPIRIFEPNTKVPQPVNIDKKKQNAIP